MDLIVGLFGKDPEPDGEIAAVLLTQGKAARRFIARHQSRLQMLKRPDERLELAVVDDSNPGRAAIIAGRRVFIFAPGTHTPERAADIAEIDRATLAEPSAVCLNELNLGFYFHLRRGTDARTFAVQVNRAILAGRPRSVPRLHPDYYLEMLASAGIPPTSENLTNLVERTVAMFGGQAGAFCAQCGSRATFDDFVRTFAPSVVQEDQSTVVDDMIDWLWARNPGFHYGIERQLGRWREMAANPQKASFLDNATVTPWQWNSGPEGAVKMWTLVFNDTKLVSPAPC